MKGKGLYLSYYYLPILVPRSIVSYKHLENSKYDFDVYAAKTNRSEQDSLLTHSKDIKIIKEVQIKSILDKFKYAIYCKKYYKKHKEDYKFIISSFMPLYSLLGGLLIKQKYKKTPWISYYSDPPATNFNKKISIIKRIYMYFEKKIANMSYKKADILLFTNKEQLDYCLSGKNEKYKYKAKVLFHSFDENLYSKNTTKNSKIIISHFGRLFGARNANSFLLALKKLKQNDIQKYNNIECRFYGNISAEQQKIIKDNKLNCVKIMGFVNYLDSLKAMSESDYLLCIDAFLSKGENVFFPSKLADYIGAFKPIIGIVPSDGTSAKLIKEVGGTILDDDEEKIYNALAKIKKEDKINHQNSLKYSAKNISKQLDEYINQLISIHK